MQAIGPLQLTIAWYKNRRAGEQTANWGIQNERILSCVALFRVSQSHGQFALQHGGFCTM